MPRFAKLTLAALYLPILAAASVSIQLEGNTFLVNGWTAGAEPSEGWDNVLRVYVGQESGDTPSVFGTYSVDKGVLSFRPSFPITPGVTYEAIFRPPGGAPVVQAYLKAAAPSKSAARTHVVAVYPSSDVLPENELKLYVLFSAPMQRGDVWPKIHLIDQQGKPGVLPFVELEQELWDRGQQRLTLLFDPGRIKRGVKPNVDMGPVLEQGKRYTLVIDANFKDGNGQALEAPFRREFTVGPAERRGIDLKLWKVTEPKKGTTEPLVIDFDRPLDYALLQDSLDVMGVKGTASVARQETEWRFQPAAPWTAGEHRVVIQMSLEDLAGNRIGRPFDVDTYTSPAARISNQTTTLPFRVK